MTDKDDHKHAFVDDEPSEFTHKTLYVYCDEESYELAISRVADGWRSLERLESVYAAADGEGYIYKIEESVGTSGFSCQLIKYWDVDAEEYVDV